MKVVTSHVPPEAQIQITKPGILNASLAEENLVLDCDEDNVTHLQVVDNVDLTSVLHVIQPLLGQDSPVVVGVQDLRFKIFLEQVKQGGERLVKEQAIGVESHEEGEHHLEVIVGVQEAVSFGFTDDGQITTLFLQILSIASQPFVTGSPQSDLVDFCIKLCKGRLSHLEVTGRCLRWGGVFVERKQ